MDWNMIYDDISELRIEGFSWARISELINNKYGLNMSSDAYRKRYNRCYRDTAQDFEAFDGVQISMEIDSEKYKARDYMNQANAYIRRISREETLKEIAEDFANKVGRVCNFDHVEPISIESNKEGILCISDWHYGIEINNYNNVYNTNIAKQRVTLLLAETLRFIKEYKIKRLHVVNLGDMIAGRIHSQIKMESRIDSVTQIMEVSELIAEFLHDLSKKTFIEYYEVLDNHSRIEPNIKESLELESLARITGFYLKQRLKDNPNININDNEFGLDIASFEVLGHSVAGVHGNKDKQKTVINSLTLYTREFYDLILTAHLHHFSADEQNETMRISNGSLMGTDSFAQKIRLNAKPSQTLIVCTKENPVYAIHKIDLE